MSDPYSPNIAKIEHCDPGWPLKYAFLHTLKFSCLFLNSFWSENLSSALLNECSILTYLLQNIKVSVLYFLRISKAGMQTIYLHPNSCMAPHKKGIYNS